MSPLAVCLLLLAAAASGGHSLAARPKCSPERNAQMDVCASRLSFLGDHSFVLPKNSSETESFCANFRDSLNCLQSHSRDCMSAFPRQISQNLLRRARHQQSSICQSESSQRKFVKRLSCLADRRIEPVHSTLDASIARIEFIRDRVQPADHKMLALCCSYQIFKRDIELALKKTCPKTQGNANPQDDPQEYVQRLASSTAGELLELICDGLQSLAECRASPKMRKHTEQLEEVTRQVARGELKPRSKSVLSVMLDVIAGSEEPTGAGG